LREKLPAATVLAAVERRSVLRDAWRLREKRAAPAAQAIFTQPSAVLFLRLRRFSGNPCVGLSRAFSPSAPVFG
jgi:hypothetical protein